MAKKRVNTNYQLHITSFSCKNTRKEEGGREKERERQRQRQRLRLRLKEREGKGREGKGKERREGKRGEERGEEVEKDLHVESESLLGLVAASVN